MSVETNLLMDTFPTEAEARAEAQRLADQQAMKMIIVLTADGYAVTTEQNLKTTLVAGAIIVAAARPADKRS